MDSSSVANRLKELINYLGLSDSQFADKCEISRATLSLLLSGKNKKVSDVLLSQIHSAFPEISIIWLLFNEGEMINRPEQVKTPEIEGNLFAEEEEFLDNDTQERENATLVDFKNLGEAVEKAVLKTIEPFLESQKNTFLKLMSDENARKVSQITVYYDDSTFQTFIPES